MASIRSASFTLVVFISALMASVMGEKVEFSYTLNQSGTICFLENVGENVNGK